MAPDTRPHKNLEVWKKGMRLVLEVYKLTNHFPRAEGYGLVSQMRRAVVSVPSNIAEGLARRTDKEKLQFLYVCQGSLSELDTQLEISRMLEFVNEEIYREIEAEILTVQKLLSGLIRSIKQD